MALFGTLLVITPKRLVDMSIVLALGMILIGLISATYILFKTIFVAVPVNADKTRR